MSRRSRPQTGSRAPGRRPATAAPPDTDRQNNTKLPRMSSWSIWDPSRRLSEVRSRTSVRPGVSASVCFGASVSVQPVTSSCAWPGAGFGARGDWRISRRSISLAPERMCGDNQCHCTNCARLRNAERQPPLLITLPHLVVSLVRFMFDRRAA